MPNPVLRHVRDKRTGTVYDFVADPDSEALDAAVEAAEDAADRAEEAAETLELDATLTSPTKAAQAEAVGDAIGEVKTDIEYTESLVDTLNNELMTDSFSDITSDLTTVGNGYYNNPSVMGATAWKNSSDTITYSYPLNSGDVVKAVGYNYYACKLVFFDSDEGPANDVVYPETTSGSNLYTYTFTAPTDGILYIGTAVNRVSSLSVSLSTTKIVKPNIIDELNNKTWLCVGDSITYNTPNYANIIADRTGIIPTNEGKTGTGYTRDSGGNVKFYERIQNITNVYDVFTIFGSTNDQAYAQSDELIGSKYDALPTDTYCAYVNAAIDAVYATGNNHLGIISPIPWNSNGGNPMYNLSGRKMANALKDICEYRGIPYLDLFRSSNMRPWEGDFRSTYIPDGTHPNTEGYKLFANRIEAFIRSL